MSDKAADDAHNQAGKAKPGLKKVRIGKLNTLGLVTTELGNLYRQAKRREIESLDASRLAGILGEMRQCMQLSLIEEKMRDLEERLGERPAATVTKLRAVS